MFSVRLSGLLAALLLFRSLTFAQTDVQVIGDAVLTPDEIAEGASVMYLVRFQNNGTDTAYQIVVRDTLDFRLDGNTLDMVAASHDYELLRDGSNVVRWYFTNVEIPPGDIDPETSFGFVLFTVQPVPFVTPTQVIGNRACVTFNQQDNFCTNSALVWIDAGAATGEPEDEFNFRVVPNPNYGQFEIRSSNQSNAPSSPSTTLSEWWITDINGKTISDGKADNVASASHQVWLEKPAPGLYLLWVKCEDDLKVQQFAVIR